MPMSFCRSMSRTIWRILDRIIPPAVSWCFAKESMYIWTAASNSSISSYEPARVIMGIMWSTMTAAALLLACMPSPGFPMM